MTPSNKYIPLDRRFADLGDGTDVEDLALRSYIGRAMGVSRDIGWKDIYRDGRSCVVLGEAGSGKSREMEEQARDLRAKGIAAAFVDLRDILGGAPLLDGVRSFNRGAAAMPLRGSSSTPWTRPSSPTFPTSIAR